MAHRPLGVSAALLGIGAALAALTLVLALTLWSAPGSWGDAVLAGCIGAAVLVVGEWFIAMTAQMRIGTTRPRAAIARLSWIVALSAALSAGVFGGSLYAAGYAFVLTAVLSVPIGLAIVLTASRTQSRPGARRVR